MNHDTAADYYGVITLRSQYDSCHNAQRTRKNGRRTDARARKGWDRRRNRETENPKRGWRKRKKPGERNRMKNKRGSSGKYTERTGLSALGEE